MKYPRKVGATSQMFYVFIADSTSTTGAGKTGLVFNTAGLVWTYAKSDDGNVAGTAVTLATMTKGTWATGGFVEKDATLLPGVYQISIPNAAISSGTHTIMVLRGATSMADCRVEIPLTAADPDVTVTQTGDSFARLGAPAGVSIEADIASIKTDTGTTIPGKLPAALVGGRMDSSVGAMAAGVQTAASYAVGAIDGAAFSTAAGNVVADAWSARNVAGGSSAGRTNKEAMYALRNRSAIAAGTLTVYQVDDVTAQWTAAVTTTAGDPLSDVNPA